MTVQKVSYQGEKFAYSYQASSEVFPTAKLIPCFSFSEAIEAVKADVVSCTVLPVENSTFGRVADVHQLLPDCGLNIIGEYFLKVDISLLGVDGANLSSITKAYSHPMLIGQCSAFLKKHGIQPIGANDTAGAARIVSEAHDPTVAALASPNAGIGYGLKTIQNNLQDNGQNRTRFLVLSKQPDKKYYGDDAINSIMFRTRNIPASLYKAIGGFATNGVNLIKLESYIATQGAKSPQFYVEIIGNLKSTNVQLALEELTHYSETVEVMGSYKPCSNRKDHIPSRQPLR